MKMHELKPPPELIISDDVKRALAEDIGTGDVTSNLLPEDLNINAQILTREAMVVCGKSWVNEVFYQVDKNIKIDWLVHDGVFLKEAAVLCELSGNARNIFAAERTALNFLQTLSATSTQTYYYVEKLNGSKTRLLDTRKTLPGLRLAQKYAVTCGGGLNHRKGLYDLFLIKENHIKACGSISKAIQKARESRSDLKITVEVENLQELQEALLNKPDRILLDNFSIKMIEKAVLMNQPKVCELEASGNINLNSILTYAKTNVDFVSVGAITKSIKAIDLSLLIKD